METERLRTIKRQVEENSAVVEQIVEQIVTKYNRELHDLMAEVKQKLDAKNDLTDEELDNITLRLPIYMYFAAGGLEVLGIEGDAAKATKMAIFNQKYLLADGTIQDKTKTAEISTLNESVIETAFIRAYKQLKTQIDMAEHVFSGVKKVVSKRMQENTFEGR